MSNELPDTVCGVREGDVLAGKYRVSNIIGAGGMGVVVAAYHIHLDEKVAIKVLHPNVIGMAEAVDRFIREARAVVKIKSDHVVRVTDVDRLPDGSPYMVMEYLEGLDLAAWIEQRGALEVEQAVEFVLQACEAVADAHALGIVHRDLKPSNLFCVRRSDGRPFIKVLDFGIYKAIGTDFLQAGPGITGTSAMLGSPLYMSPEQMRASRDVDARTDIWSMGVILYELLTGKVPFDGTAIPEICVRVATQPAPPLSTYRSNVPPELDAILDKCLQKERSHRYLNVAELARALAPLGPRRSQDSAERISRVLHEAGLTGTALTFPESSRRSPKELAADTMAGVGNTHPGSKHKRLTKLWVGLGIVAVAIAVGAVLLVRQKMMSASPSMSSTINPLTSAVPLVVNATSVVAPQGSIAEGSRPSASDEPQQALRAAPTSTAPGVQPKLVASAIASAPVIRAPDSESAVKNAPRNSAKTPTMARSSQSPRQNDSRAAVSAAPSAAAKTAPQNTIGGRL